MFVGLSNNLSSTKLTNHAHKSLHLVENIDEQAKISMFLRSPPIAAAAMRDLLQFLLSLAFEIQLGTRDLQPSN